MKKNEKEKVLRKQKIKNVIFNILHTLGYISMGVVLLCGIGLGVTSCKTKQNKNTSVSEVPYTDVKKDDNLNNKFNSGNFLIVPFNDFMNQKYYLETYKYIINYHNVQVNVKTSISFASNTIGVGVTGTMFIALGDNFYAGSMELQKYYNGSYNNEITFKHSDSLNTYTSGDIRVRHSASGSYDNNGTMWFYYYDGSSWVQNNATVFGKSLYCLNTSMLYYAYGQYYDDLVGQTYYDSGYGEGESVGYESGYGEGESVGYESGYGEGYSEGLQDGNSYDVDINPNDVDLNQYRNAKLNTYYEDFYNKKNLTLLNGSQVKFNYDYIFNFIVYSGLFDISQRPYIYLNQLEGSIFEVYNIDDEFSYSSNYYDLTFSVYLNGNDIIYEVLGSSEGVEGSLYKKTNNFIEYDIFTEKIFKYDIAEDENLYIDVGYGVYELKWNIFEIPYSYSLDNNNSYNYPLFNIIANTIEIQNYDFIFNSDLNLCAFYGTNFYNNAINMNGTSIATINSNNSYIYNYGKFYSNGMYFDSIKIICADLMDSYYIPSNEFNPTTNPNPKQWDLSGYMYPLYMSYINSVTGVEKVVSQVQYATREGGYSILLGDYKWVNDSYRYVSFLDNDYNPKLEFHSQKGLTSKQLLNNANNSNIGSSVSTNLGTSNNNIFTLFKSAFGSIVPILSMSLMPGITIGILLFLPLVVGIIILVFKLLRK